MVAWSQAPEQSRHLRRSSRSDEVHRGSCVVKMPHLATRSTLALGLAVVVLAAAILAFTLESGPSSTTRNSEALTVNEFDCAKGWSPPRSGQRELTIRNAG